MKTDPRNFTPPERVAIKGQRFGIYFVEFAERHGTRTKVVLRKDYGTEFFDALRAFSDELAWLETGTLPTDRM